MVMIEALVALFAMITAVFGCSRVIAMDHLHGSRAISGADSGRFGRMHRSRKNRDDEDKKEREPLHRASRYHGRLATAIYRSPRRACDAGSQL